MATKIITLDLPDPYTREDVIAELRAWADALESSMPTESAPVAPTPAPTPGAQVVYILAPGSLSKMATGQAELLRAEIGRRGEATAAELQEATGLKRKSVESALWQLRHHGIIQSVPRSAGE